MLYTSELVEPVMASTVGQFYQCDQTARLIHMTWAWSDSSQRVTPMYDQSRMSLNNNHHLMTSETHLFLLCFLLSIADRPMEGLEQRPDTTKKNITMMLGQEARGGSERFQNNQKVLLENSYEDGGDETSWT